MIEYISVGPLDVINLAGGAVAGGLVGYALVHIVDWVRRPRVEPLGFQQVPVNFGTLYKFRFRLNGTTPPGLCCLEIKWRDNSVFGKWDETPNPLNSTNVFEPELVPATFYQPLFLKREYEIPIAIENSQCSREIFSDWRFGWPQYGRNPTVNNSKHLEITLTGGSFTWSDSYIVQESCDV